MKSITTKTKYVLSENNYRYSDSLKIAITHTVLDDDLLDLKFFKLNDLCKNESGEIIFSGINIFDKYNYSLRYKWE